MANIIHRLRAYLRTVDNIEHTRRLDACEATVREWASELFPPDYKLTFQQEYSPPSNVSWLPNDPGQIYRRGSLNATETVPYDTALEHPLFYIASVTHGIISLEAKDELNGVQLSARLSLVIDLPKEEIQFLRRLGKIEWEVPEPSRPYETLRC